jgi:hypothetical protein
MNVADVETDGSDTEQDHNTDCPCAGAIAAPSSPARAVGHIATGAHVRNADGVAAAGAAFGVRVLINTITWYLRC